MGRSKEKNFILDKKKTSKETQSIQKATSDLTSL
jgi:hypothetical protein